MAFAEIEIMTGQSTRPYMRRVVNTDRIAGANLEEECGTLFMDSRIGDMCNANHKIRLTPDSTKYMRMILIEAYR